METLIRIFAVFVLVAANGFFVTSEFAIVSVRRMRIATLAEGGDKSARRLLAFKDNLGAYISATQLGVTLSSLALGWIGEATHAETPTPPFMSLGEALPPPFGDYFSVGARHFVASAIAFVLITFLHIVLGEQVPKMLGIERSERVALMTVGPMYWFSWLFRIPIRLRDVATSGATRALVFFDDTEPAEIYTEEEIKQLVNISHK